MNFMDPNVARLLEELSKKIDITNYKLDKILLTMGPSQSSNRSTVVKQESYIQMASVNQAISTVTQPVPQLMKNNTSVVKKKSPTKTQMKPRTKQQARKSPASLEAQVKKQMYQRMYRLKKKEKEIMEQQLVDFNFCS